MRPTLNKIFWDQPKNLYAETMPYDAWRKNVYAFIFETVSLEFMDLPKGTEIMSVCEASYGR